MIKAMYHALQKHSSNAGCTFIAQWFICISKYDKVIDHSLCPGHRIAGLGKISRMSRDMLIT